MTSTLRTFIALLLLLAISAAAAWALPIALDDRQHWSERALSYGWPFAVATAAVWLSSRMGRLPRTHGVLLIACTLATAALCGALAGFAVLFLIVNGAGGVVTAVDMLSSGEAGSGPQLWSGILQVVGGMLLGALFWLAAYALEHGWRLAR